MHSFLDSWGESICYEKMEIPWVPCTTLVLHGAWQWDMSRTDELRKALFEVGIPTLAIDFSGHGKSSKNLPCSIGKRIREARDAIALLDTQSNISLIGFSMSGEVSIQLTQYFSVQNIILFSPWIYHRDVIQMPFGEAFTQALRAHESWKHTAIWEILSNFKWAILLFTPEFDTVIPEWVNEIIMRSAPMAKKERIIIEGAPHMVWKWMNENPGRVPSIVWVIKKCY